jgi:DNA-binding GntR family transcriptional regulator
MWGQCMADAADRAERPRPVSELVLDRLRRDIIENRFELGEKISEAQLSDLYGVTKAPIRSAYIRLEGEGLIDIRAQAGTFVFRPTVEAVRLAMSRDPAGLKADFRRILTAMEEALRVQSRDVYQQLDTELHLAILARANSPLLEKTYRTQVNGRFAALRYRFSQDQRHNANSIAEHRLLRDAVVADDLPELIRLMRAHIGNTEGYYAGLAM